MKESRTFTKRSRRAYLRGVGAVALGVGAAGCSSDGGGSGGGASGSAGESGPPGSAETDATSGAGTDETASERGTASSKATVTDASATGLTGTVADRSAAGLSFVEHSHYSMNGMQGVTGRVENTGDAAFETVTIHVTVKPGDAGPFAETLDGDEPLEPGDARRFKFAFGDGAPDEVEDYTVWATGERA